MATAEKRWSQPVTETSNALDLKEGVFALDEIRDSGPPVVIDHVAEDPAFCGHPTPAPRPRRLPGRLPGGRLLTRGDTLHLPHAGGGAEPLKGGGPGPSFGQQDPRP
jgi:hypothetical protein